MKDSSSGINLFFTTMAKVAGERRNGHAYHRQISGSNAMLPFKYLVLFSVIIESPSQNYSSPTYGFLDRRGRRDSQRLIIIVFPLRPSAASAVYCANLAWFDLGR